MIIDSYPSFVIRPPIEPKELETSEPERYVFIGFPEIQKYMTHPRWNECYLVVSRDDQEYLDSTYAVPESLFEEFYEEF